MGVSSERDIYIKASRSFDLLLKSIQIFEDYLKDGYPANSPEYYRAKNFLKEGEAGSQEMLKEAKKLLGPTPAYATKEVGQWRTQQAEEAKIVVRGGSLEELETELAGDEFLAQRLTREEVAASLRKLFDSQKTGKRKLANIKARMMLDKLFSLIEKARELQKSAQKKQQGQPL